MYVKIISNPSSTDAQKLKVVTKVGQSFRLQEQNENTTRHLLDLGTKQLPGDVGWSGNARGYLYDHFYWWVDKSDMILSYPSDSIISILSRRFNTNPTSLALATELSRRLRNDECTQMAKQPKSNPCPNEETIYTTSVAIDISYTAT